MQMQEMASVEVSGPSWQTKTHTFRQTQHQDPLICLCIPQSFGDMLQSWYWNTIDFPYHTFHLPGAAGTIPHKSWIINFFVCHLGLVTILVVEIMALLAFNQLVSHGHCHLSYVIKKDNKDSEQNKNTARETNRRWSQSWIFYTWKCSRIKKIAFTWFTYN